MLEGGYIFLLVILGMVAAISILVRYGYRSKYGSDKEEEQGQEEQRGEGRTSTLAERMEDVLRAQPDQDGRYSPSSYRRRSVAAAAAAATAATGDSSRLRPSSSFRLASRRREDTSTAPREDSPLLGPRPFEEKEEEKAENQRWDLLAQGEDQRGLGAAMGGGGGGGDMESGRGRSVSPSGGSESGSGGGRSRRTTVSAAPTTLSAADDALLGTFMEVMSEGLPIKIHRSSGRARKTTMWLKDTDTLVWFTKRTVGGKRWHKLSLRGVTSVNAGKNSEPLESRSAASADPALCLSLGFPSLTLGLEGSSELERDALVQGFSMLIEDLKAADDLQHFRDPEIGTIRNI